MAAEKNDKLVTLPYAIGQDCGHGLRMRVGRGQPYISFREMVAKLYFINFLCIINMPVPVYIRALNILSYVSLTWVCHGHGAF